MTPYAFMAQQLVLKALADVRDSATWIDKTQFQAMVESPSTFQYAIAPKLEPSQSRRVAGEDRYIRHIRGLFDKFAPSRQAPQGKQDIFKHPDQFFNLPIEEFNRVMGIRETVPMNEVNMTIDNRLYQIMEADRRGDSREVSRLL